MLLIGRKFGKIKQDLVPDVDSSLSLPGMFANFVPFRRDPLACEETRDGLPGFLSPEKQPGRQRRLLGR